MIIRNGPISQKIAVLLIFGITSDKSYDNEYYSKVLAVGGCD